MGDMIKLRITSAGKGQEREQKQKWIWEPFMEMSCGVSGIDKALSEVSA